MDLLENLSIKLMIWGYPYVWNTSIWIQMKIETTEFDIGQGQNDICRMTTKYQQAYKSGYSQQVQLNMLCMLLILVYLFCTWISQAHPGCWPTTINQLDNPLIHSQPSSKDPSVTLNIVILCDTMYTLMQSVNAIHSHSISTMYMYIYIYIPKFDASKPFNECWLHHVGT